MNFDKIKFRICNIIKIFIINCMIVNLYGCALVVRENTIVKGVMWEVSKNGKVNTVIGTMHPMPVNYEHMNKSLINKLENASGVAVQLDITNPNVIADLHNERQLPKDDNIENYLDKKEIKKLEDVINRFNREVDLDEVKKLNPKGIYNIIMNLNYLETGFVSSSNESEIILGAKEKKIPVVELIGLENSDKFFNELFTWETMKIYLDRPNRREVNEKKKIADSIFQAYADGNIDRLISIEEEIREVDGFEREYTKVFNYTNSLLVENIDKLANEKENYIYAIDYRRLIGNDSVLLELEKKGYTIKRIN